MFDRTRDAKVRTAAFDWLREQTAVFGDELPRSILTRGFEFEGTRVPLLSQQGIFKPRILERVPLSITTTVKSTYRDTFGPDDRLRYRYRGTDPEHPDNVGLREAFRMRIPLVYFHAIVPGIYLPAWPVFVVWDDPKELTFGVAIDDPRALPALENPASWHVGSADPEAELRRAYATRYVKVRIHQKSFRARVLEAYRRQCSFCRLRHEELLDAAHITPDADLAGEPVVTNGLALCALHHAAFDRNFVGVRPDLTLIVRQEILAEEDGPTLTHAIQALHGTRICVPRSAALRPDPGRLESRFQEFLATPLRRAQ